MLLISGWASDHRIFDTLDIRYNYLIPIDFLPATLAADLPVAIKENNIDKISMLGWSMGAFIIWEALSGYRDPIGEVFLVSARSEYSKANNEKIKALLEKNKKGFLRKFYSDCFSDEDCGSFSSFKNGLMKDYIESMDLERLLDGLGYLSEHRIRPRRLNGLKVRFIHGVKDVIAPVEEVKELVRNMPEARFIPVAGAGHMPFLARSFREAML